MRAGTDIWRKGRVEMRAAIRKGRVEMRTAIRKKGTVEMRAAIRKKGGVEMRTAIRKKGRVEMRAAIRKKDGVEMRAAIRQKGGVEMRAGTERRWIIVWLQMASRHFKCLFSITYFVYTSRLDRNNLVRASVPLFQLPTFRFLRRKSSFNINWPGLYLSGLACFLS